MALAWSTFNELPWQSKTNIIVGAIMSGIAAISVALRFVSKASIGTKFKSDDWWVLCALVLMGAGMGILTCGALRGFADPFFLGQALIIGSILYPAVTTSIRFSILCLYYRLFSTAPIRKSCYWIGTLSVLWCVVVITATTVVCLPVSPSRRLWGTVVTGYCFNYDAFALAMGIVETIIDTVVLVLPINLILSLRLARRDKIFLIGVFLVGIFIIFTGILRSKYSYIPHSTRLNEFEVELWSYVRCGTAVFCACLPTYRPLGRLVTTCVNQRHKTKLQALANKCKSNNNRKSIALEARKTNTYNELRDYQPEYVHLTTIEGGDYTHQEEHNEGNTITIERTIHIT